MAERSSVTHVLTILKISWVASFDIFTFFAADPRADEPPPPTEVVVLLSEASLLIWVVVGVVREVAVVGELTCEGTTTDKEFSSSTFITRWRR